MSFCIRPARTKDLRDLHRLSSSLSARGFLTLAPTQKGIEQQIKLSERSFAGHFRNSEEGGYLFVLEDRDRNSVVGCSLILARHGTLDSPHIYFEVVEVQKASPKLKKAFKHQILRLRLDAEGATELGGLILDPSYRSHPLKLGKHLSYARLHYIQRHPERFRDRLLVELLPPLSPEGDSAFWDSVGRRFTGLDYLEADRLSHEDKEFITSLFPEGDIYTTFLPEEARRVIGQTAPEARPVARMLEAVGFRYLNQIDPFDGGPHFGAAREEIRYAIVEEFLRGAAVTLELPEG